MIAIRRPLIILGLPRSGTTMLFELLSQSPSFFTIGGESQMVIEGIRELSTRRRGYVSNRLTEADATAEVCEALRKRFAMQLRDRGGARPSGEVRMLEKTPRNVLRASFLRAVFPDAIFLYLHRDAAATVSSMLDAWRSGKFVTHRDLPGWRGPSWSLLLIPGWRELIGRPLAEITATQWATATSILLDDLESLPPGQWHVTRYSDVVQHPRAEVERLCRIADVEWDREVPAELPVSKSALTPPDAAKIARNAADLAIAEPLFREAARRAEALVAARQSESGR
jgi:hypothetical protein